MWIYLTVNNNKPPNETLTKRVMSLLNALIFVRVSLGIIKNKKEKMSWQPKVQKSAERQHCSTFSSFLNVVAQLRENEKNACRLKYKVQYSKVNLSNRLTERRRRRVLYRRYRCSSNRKVLPLAPSIKVRRWNKSGYAKPNIPCW